MSAQRAARSTINRFLRRFANALATLRGLVNLARSELPGFGYRHETPASARIPRQKWLENRASACV
jgi:hypothetical protein